MVPQGAGWAFVPGTSTAVAAVATVSRPVAPVSRPEAVPTEVPALCAGVDVAGDMLNADGVPMVSLCRPGQSYTQHGHAADLSSRQSPWQLFRIYAAGSLIIMAGCCECCQARGMGQEWSSRQGAYLVSGSYHALAASGGCHDRIIRVVRVRICLQQSGCQLHRKRALRHLQHAYSDAVPSCAAHEVDLVTVSSSPCKCTGGMGP